MLLAEAARASDQNAKAMGRCRHGSSCEGRRADRRSTSGARQQQPFALRGAPTTAWSSYVSGRVSNARFDLAERRLRTPQVHGVANCCILPPGAGEGFECSRREGGLPQRMGLPRPP
jgi:hypothetical protein